MLDLISLKTSSCLLQDIRNKYILNVVIKHTLKG